MEKRLQIIRHLYGEGEDRAAYRRLLAEEELRREHEALSEVKFYLDHRKPVRPDPGTVDRVVAMAARGAAGEAGPGGRRARGDRAALRRRSTHPARMLAVSGALVALLLAVGTGLWQFRPGASGEVLATYEAAPPPAAYRQGSSPERAAAPEALAPQAAAAEAETAGLSDASENLAWDDADEVHRLRQRIEMLEARAADLSWDAPVVTPEMLLQGSGGTGLDAGPGGLQQTSGRRGDQ